MISCIAANAPPQPASGGAVNPLLPARPSAINGELVVNCLETSKLETYILFFMLN